MKKIILSLLMTGMTIYSISQVKPIPRIEKDTLYTVSGFMFYPGLTLATGPYKRHYSANHGFGEHFRYIKGMSFPNDPKNWCDSIMILKVESLSKSALNNIYVRVRAKVHYTDGSSNKATLNINFEEAIKPKNRESSELIIP
jgi:hypothetical protein